MRQSLSSFFSMVAAVDLFDRPVLLLNPQRFTAINVTCFTLCNAMETIAPTFLQITFPWHAFCFPLGKAMAAPATLQDFLTAPSGSPEPTQVNRNTRQQHSGD